LMRILIDLDGICCDLLKVWLEDYNKKYGDTLTKDDITTFKMADVVKEEARKDIIDIIKAPDYFCNLGPIPGAIEAIKRLRANHEVRLVSSPMGIDSFSDKAWWVENRLKLNRRNLMLVPSADKHWIQTDVIIDDKPSTLVSFANKQPNVHRITISYPYNTEIESLCSCYAADHNNTSKAWATIVSYIEGLSL